MIQFYMPTKVLWGENVVREQAALMQTLGTKALIVTGRYSAKKNGALEDVKAVLNEAGIAFAVFDRVEENPPLANIEEGAGFFSEAEFVIGIGGGSPIDAAKAMAVAMKYPKMDLGEVFWSGVAREALPVIAIPTTAGTGTEVNPYAILTDREAETKRNFNQQVYPVAALMDVRYFMTMPRQVRSNTGIDALTHLIESYLTVRATPFSRAAAEEGMREFAKIKERLDAVDFTKDEMLHLMMASMAGGISIGQAGTSLPHGMGYALTYFHDMPHGKANGVLTRAYLERCSDRPAVCRILECLRFPDIEALGDYIFKMVGGLEITDAQIVEYAASMAENAAKLKNHPDPIGQDGLEAIYRESRRQ